MKNSFLLIILLHSFINNAFAQSSANSGKSALEVTKFQTDIGIVAKTTFWDITKPIKLPTQPTLLSVTVKDDTQVLDLICIIHEEIKLYDTIRIGNNNTVNFFNLSGGEYKLTFINRKNNHKTQVSFSIEAVFWEKWWFSPFVFLIISIILGLTFYVLYLIRLRQQLRTQIVRDTIARDLHDDIGSYLSSISILSQNVDNLILNNPEKARQSLTKIGETARQVMDTMGDIVWSINPTHDSMEQVVNRMKDFANELFFNQDIEINFQASESLKKVNLTLERRRDFFLIYKESMTNIYKYAEANLVNISLQYLDNQVFLKVEDNGKGFEMEQLPKNRASGGNGLKNMKVRAEKLNGKLEISSKINQGTSILLTFEP